MSDDSDLAGRALEQLSLAPQRPSFFDTLRVRMHEHDRRAARRWRRMSAVLGVIAAAAVAATAVLASTVAHSSVSTRVVDQTLSCAVQLRTSAHALDVSAETENTDPAARTSAAYLDVYTFTKKATSNLSSPFVPQVEFGSVLDSLKVDRSLCRPSHRSVALRPSGLTPNGTVTPTFQGGFEQRCITAARALIRLRLSEVGGVPTRAQVAIRDDNAKETPIAYVVWGPKRISYSLEDNCVPYNGGG